MKKKKLLGFKHFVSVDPVSAGIAILALLCAAVLLSAGDWGYALFVFGMAATVYDSYKTSYKAGWLDARAWQVSKEIAEKERGL